MKKTLITSLIAASFAVAAGSAAAADTGNIRFTGQITTSACSIAGGQNGTDMQVPLGTISTNQFTATGDRGPMSDFSITLLGCDASQQSIKLSFAPAAGAVQGTGLLGLENGGGAGTGSASGVAVGIVDAAGNSVVVGGTPVIYNITENTNIFSFKAFYESIDATVTAGAANARAVFTVDYS